MKKTFLVNLPPREHTPCEIFLICTCDFNNSRTWQKIFLYFDAGNMRPETILKTY